MFNKPLKFIPVKKNEVYTGVAVTRPVAGRQAILKTGSAGAFLRV
jgi:hypothetical protein